MNKTELVDHISSTVDVSRALAGRALEAMLNAIEQSLKKGEDVTLVGFGTFSVTNMAARDGHNPQTGAKIKIKARKKPSFRAGKGLKDSVNSGK